MLLPRRILICAASLVFAATFESAASSDVVRLKNGDAYRGTIIEEKEGEYVQLELKDGNEKRIPQSEIATVERRNAEAPAQEPPAQHPPVQSSPAMSLAEPLAAAPKPDVLELDFQAFAVDGASATETLKVAGVPKPNETKTSYLRIRSAPSRLTLRAQAAPWTFQFGFDSTSETFSGFATGAHAIGDRMQLGLRFRAQRNDLTVESENENLAQFLIAPYLRILIPTSSSNRIETDLFAGLTWMNLSTEDEDYRLAGDGTLFSTGLRVVNALSISSRISWLAEVEVEYNAGTLSGHASTETNTRTGSLKLENFRYRVVPVGVRISL